jgi:hypothetical protein
VVRGSRGYTFIHVCLGLLSRSQQYAQPVTKKGIKSQQPVAETEEKKLSNHAQRNLDERKKGTMEAFKLASAVLMLSHTEAKIDPLLESQFGAGRLYATISSRPGQSGRADGYILEGKELEVRARSRHIYDSRSLQPRSSTSGKLGQESRNTLTPKFFPAFSPSGWRNCSGCGLCSKNRVPLVLYYCMTYVHCNLCSSLHIFCETRKIILRS